jgi:hypothetical protein
MPRERKSKLALGHRGRWFVGFVPQLQSFLRKKANVLKWMACGAVVAFFTWRVALMYLPGQGLTYFVEFGEKEHARYLPEVKASNHYEMPDSEGYDGWSYVQIAMRPNLSDPALGKAVFGLPYRARRILFLWTAWLLGGGNPVRVMNAYAAQNIICWYLLAWLLFRWFPPVSWGNWARWAAVLFSFGLIVSVRSALLDGPSLLLIATGILLAESNRPWMAAVVLGISGLGKDTNILGAVGLDLPGQAPRRAWLAWLARVALVLLPLGVWAACLAAWMGKGADVGARNFSGPFCGMAGKAAEIASNLIADSSAGDAVIRYDIFDLLVVGGLLFQLFFIASRIRWRDPWWRVGAGYAVLMAFLGDSVWEGYPSAAARVLLPMTLAFNILVPKRRWWPILLIAGNLGVLASFDVLKPPYREACVVQDTHGLRTNPDTGDRVEGAYGPRNWFGPKKSRFQFGRWSMGESEIYLRNPQPFPIVADVAFHVRSADARRASVSCGGKVLWSAGLAVGEMRRVTLPGLVLSPGDTVLVFQSDRPASYPDDVDRRKVTLFVWNLEMDLKGRR